MWGTKAVDKRLLGEWAWIVGVTALTVGLTWYLTTHESKAALPEHGRGVCFSGIETNGGQGWQCKYHTEADYRNAKWWLFMKDARPAVEGK